MNTLTWRNEQLHLIRTLIEHLEHEGLIERRNALINKFRKPKDIPSEVYGKLWAIPGVRDLLYPPGDDKVPSLFRDWVELLFKSIIERYIDSETLEAAANRIHSILG